MDEGINICRPRASPAPGELCRTKYVVHDYQRVTLVIQ
jgi:hypothetical protein